MKEIDPKVIREAVKTYNKNNPEDKISYQEVYKELKDVKEFACESLVEEMEQVKEKWYENNRNYTEYLSHKIDIREFVSSGDFAIEVYSSVRASYEI